MYYPTAVRLAVTTHDKQVGCDVATKVVESVCDVDELLPRCERLILASRRVIESVSSSLPSRTLGQMSPRGNNSVPYYLVSVTLPLRLRILS